ncbi:DUF3189 family protein [Alteribacter natronophilus]|uniref:DUF3189 family protein n=1 Tax=Alteribacter natronophilus TaxID=2583810 RepID=UPI00110D3243|nr:DUF3189 family protein [Alteribacter natronophilus]TMW73308.1 DUF3189 family protein [Alteribacter natronophilus]
MIYIYYDFGGTHSTSMAAAYHLGLLNRTGDELTKEEIEAIPYFNKLEKQDAGEFIFRGTDEGGNEVYTIGKRREKLVVPSLINFIHILEGKRELTEKVVFSHTSPTVPLAMTFGGFFARGLGINAIGFPLLVIGARQASSSIRKLVEKTKMRGTKEDSPQVIHLLNEEFQA